MKGKIMKRSLSFILALILILPAVFSSCQSTDGTVSDTTDSSNCTHASMAEWAFAERRTCIGQGFYTRACADCGYSEEELRDMQPEDPEYRSFDKKTVMFIGNSFVYYGYCVMEGKQGSLDKGYFYQICKANGETVRVYDYVWGGATLAGIYDEHLQSASAKKIIEKTDVVFMSEAGQNNGALVNDVVQIMELFPEKTEFYYLNHAYTVSSTHTKITDSFDTLQNLGVGIVNWGELAVDVWTGKTPVPGGTLKYDKNSFVVNKLDSHHQNMLSGYLTAQMSYCAYTLRSAQGQDHSICTNKGLNGAFDAESYEEKYYKPDTTNLAKVFASDADMQGFKVLMDRYLDKYGIKVGKQMLLGEHEYLEEPILVSAGAKDTPAVLAHKCIYCNGSIVSEADAVDSTLKNIMLVTKDDLAAAGVDSVKAYVNGGHSIAKGVASSGWGRAGHSAIVGQHAAGDGSRSCIKSTRGDMLYWKISSLSAKYNASGERDAEGAKYCTLIGYDLKETQKVSSFAIYLDVDTAPKAFDLLGGKKNADGTISWTTLASCTDIAYYQYNKYTLCFSTSFDAQDIDCFQLGIVSTPDRSLYISEIELMG